jgi:O-antigen/teichoic acid export membrane protein
MILGRILGLAFSVVLAAIFVPADYGAIQYGITLGLLIAMLSQPFGQHVLARFIGRYKTDSSQLRLALTNSWLLQGIITLLTLLIAVAVLTLINRFDPGVIAVFLGVTIFYSYWGLSSGFLASTRLTIAFVGSNLFQLVLVFALVALLQIHSPLLVLIIYGSSYLLPLTLLQIFRPLPFSFAWSSIDRGAIRELLSFAGPVWIFHICYTLYMSAAILLLEYYASDTELGIFAAARTLSFAFAFLPTALSALLMPQVASLVNQHDKLKPVLIRTLIVSTACNLLIFIFYVLLVEWFVRTAFAPAYASDMAPYIIMAVSSIILGIHGVVSAVVIGMGQPGVTAISYAVAVLCTGLVGWWLIPQQGATGGAIAMLSGSVVALATYEVARWSGLGKQAAPSVQTEPDTGPDTGMM